MALFDPQKLALYRLCRRHSRAVHELIKAGKCRGHGVLINQLRESTASIPANVLESTGDSRPGKRLNYLMIAKGSTWESWAHTDTMVDFGIVSEGMIGEVRAIQNEITAVLITTIRRLETEIAGTEKT